MSQLSVKDNSQVQAQFNPLILFGNFYSTDYRTYKTALGALKFVKEMLPSLKEKGAKVLLFEIPKNKTVEENFELLTKFINKMKELCKKKDTLDKEAKDLLKQHEPNLELYKLHLEIYLQAKELVMVVEPIFTNSAGKDEGEEIVKQIIQYSKKHDGAVIGLASQIYRKRVEYGISMDVDTQTCRTFFLEPENLQSGEQLDKYLQKVRDDVMSGKQKLGTGISK